MSYSYLAHRAYVFTEPGQERFLAVLAFAKKAITLAGAVKSDKLDTAAARPSPSNDTGLSWDYMACTDRLVELGYLREIEQGRARWQDRIFVQGEKAFP